MRHCGVGQAGRQATLLQLFVVMCSLGACTLSLASFHSLQFQQSFFPVRFICSPSPCFSVSRPSFSVPLQHFCLPLFFPSSLVISFKICTFGAFCAASRGPRLAVEKSFYGSAGHERESWRESGDEQKRRWETEKSTSDLCPSLPLRLFLFPSRERERVIFFGTKRFCAGGKISISVVRERSSESFGWMMI